MTVLALFGGVFSIAKYRSLSTQNIEGNAAAAELERETSELKLKGEKVQQSLSPAQKQLMIAGHKLVATKEFGWSRLLYDIERVLPSDVSASRISVENVFKDGNSVAAELEFAVVSRNYTSVLNMIERMNSSGIFRANLRGQDLQEGDRIVYSEYTMLVTYRPSAGFSSSQTSDVASAGERGGTPGDR